MVRSRIQHVLGEQPLLPWLMIECNPKREALLAQQRRCGHTRCHRTRSNDPAIMARCTGSLHGHDLRFPDRAPAGQPTECRHGNEMPSPRTSSAAAHMRSHGSFMLRSNIGWNAQLHADMAMWEPTGRPMLNGRRTIMVRPRMEPSNRPFCLGTHSGAIQFCLGPHLQGRPSRRMSRPSTRDIIGGKSVARKQPGANSGFSGISRPAVHHLRAQPVVILPASRRHQ